MLHAAISHNQFLLHDWLRSSWEFRDFFALKVHWIFSSNFLFASQITLSPQSHETVTRISLQLQPPFRFTIRANSALKFNWKVFVHFPRRVFRFSFRDVKKHLFYGRLAIVVEWELHLSCETAVDPNNLPGIEHARCLFINASYSIYKLELHWLCHRHLTSSSLSWSLRVHSRVAT